MTAETFNQCYNSLADSSTHLHLLECYGKSHSASSKIERYRSLKLVSIDHLWS